MPIPKNLKYSSPETNCFVRLSNYRNSTNYSSSKGDPQVGFRCFMFRNLSGCYCCSKHARGEANYTCCLATTSIANHGRGAYYSDSACCDTNRA